MFTAPPAETVPGPVPHLLHAAPRSAEKPLASAPHTAVAPERLAALPPPQSTPSAAPVTTDKPQITIIRGSRQAVRVREPDIGPRKLAALPPNSWAARTASDAPPIIVLRGRATRYASAARIEPARAPEPAVLTVIRGARPQPVRLVPYMQPGPLILHIPGR